MLPRCLFMIGLFAGVVARGNDDSPIVHLEPVTVVDRPITDSPATVTTIDLTVTPGGPTTAAIADEAPNFFIATNRARGFNDTFELRGLANTPIFGDPAVTVYLDDLPLGSAFTIPDELTGFTRAELHRGPTQNTIFGRAGSAGVLEILTPVGESGPRFSASVDVGNFAQRDAAIEVQTANTGAADVWVSAGTSTRDGYVRNTTLDRDVDDRDSRSGLVRFRLRPGGGVELRFLVTALHARDGAEPLVPLDGPMFTVQRSAEGRMDFDSWNAALSASIPTAVGQLVATTSASDWNLHPYTNTLAFGPAELTDVVDQRQRGWNEEIRLTSASTGDVTWRSGLFASSTRTEGAYDRTFGPFPYERSMFNLRARDLAAFGEATWAPDPTMRVTFGLRAEASHKDIDRSETVPAIGSFALQRDAGAFLPKLGWSYASAPGMSWFATAGAGFKPGGFSAFTGNAALASFAPERTHTLEAGMVMANAVHTLEATLRAFAYDIRGYQIERSFATGGTGNDYLVVNASRARSLGGEIELRWRPTSSVTVAASAGLTDVTLREFTDPFTGISYAGDRAPAVPAYDLSLRADYEMPRGFFVGAAVISNGRTYYTESEDLHYGQRAYFLVGAHVGYAWKHWRVTLFGENLTDVRYYSAITPGTEHGTPGAPRTYGVELRTGF
ncbi:MAG TPA: TonB-dependent receptor [Candidatus Didemnitutus sp.]|nr:TonB-dependent receptor [Candidatus Didemnitutus sp.]